MFSQGAHQVDIVRLLGGRATRAACARSTGAWDPARPTEGAYAALLAFDDGAFASLVYSGYAHFDSDELVGWIGELGQRKDPAQYGAARAALAQRHVARRKKPRSRTTRATARHAVDERTRPSRTTSSAW